jgi:hypothetical protein
LIMSTTKEAIKEVNKDLKIDQDKNQLKDAV